MGRACRRRPEPSGLPIKPPVSVAAAAQEVMVHRTAVNLRIHQPGYRRFLFGSAYKGLPKQRHGQEIEHERPRQMAQQQRRRITVLGRKKAPPRSEQGPDVIGQRPPVEYMVNDRYFRHRRIMM